MDMPLVWVISSDSDARRLIGLNLSKRGLQTREISPKDELAPSGAEPHLIILDSDPAAKVDWRAATALRQDPRLREVPLLLILAAPPTSSRLVPLQPVRWVEKPLDMDALVSLVRESLAWPGEGLA